MRGPVDSLEDLLPVVAYHSSQELDRFVARWHSAQGSTVVSKGPALVPLESGNEVGEQSLPALSYPVVCLCALVGRSQVRWDAVEGDSGTPGSTVDPSPVSGESTVVLSQRGTIRPFIVR